MRLRLLLVVFWISNIAPMAQGQTQSFDPIPARQFILAEIDRKAAPGAALAVIKDGEVIHASGFGLTEAGSGQQVTPEHVFRSASTLKMMVGTALVHLHDTGKLDLHAPISTYLAGLDPAVGQLTTHQLLNHTSGILDTSVAHTTRSDMNLLEYAQSLDDSFIYVSPGASFSYSNPGYALAGAVLEAVVGKPFDAAMTDVLFEPLEMHSSTFSIDAAREVGLALGHRQQAGGHAIVQPREEGLAARPSGTMFSTVLDYANFLAAFLQDGRFKDRQIWSKSATEMMKAKQIPDSNLVMSYSYSFGLMNGTFYGQPALFHTGGMPGYASNVLILPELDLAVVLFTNGEEMNRNAVLYRVVSQFVELKPMESLPSPTDIVKLDASAAEELLGTYMQRDDLPKIQIRREGSDVILRNRDRDYTLYREHGDFYIGLTENDRWFRFKIAKTADGQYRFVQWWIRSFARRLD